MDEEIATFASGCFWCIEAIFQRVKGVKTVTSGYAGGTVKNPSYEEVCTGKTGHAESIQIVFDPKIVSYQTLLDIFWHTHNPTTPNQQGNDIGTQYRSVVFYHNEEQKNIAEAKKKKLQEQQIWPNPIVTEIVPFTNFFEAEDYHQNYFNKNQNAGYCQIIINPKLQKYRKELAQYFKDDA